MTRRAAFFLLITIGGMVAIMALMAGVYRSGSGYLPGWITAIKPGDLSAKHAFLGEQCEACHTPFRGVEARSCITCHAENSTLLERQSTAFHATIQDCSGCHIEHQGAATRPVLINHAQLVRIGMRADVDRQRQGRSASARIEAFIANLSGSAPVPESQVLDCSACHSNRNPHQDGTVRASDRVVSPATVGSLFGLDCVACHTLTTWKIGGYRHPSPNSGDCAQCHQAPPSHFMGHFKMISMMVAGQPHARVEQCYLCHQTNAWNDIRGVGWFKHH